MLCYRSTEYVCPKCGYFNPSARTLREIKQGKKSRSPDGRAPLPTAAAGEGNFAPPIGAPTSATAPNRAPSEDGTSMDVDS